jgi:hypothetical protein
MALTRLSYNAWIARGLDHEAALVHAQAVDVCSDCGWESTKLSYDEQRHGFVHQAPERDHDTVHTGWEEDRQETRRLRDEYTAVKERFDNGEHHLEAVKDHLGVQLWQRLERAGIDTHNIEDLNDDRALGIDKRDLSQTLDRGEDMGYGL